MLPKGCSLSFVFFLHLATYCFYASVSLADAINNAAGYGFKGMDANGRPSWDLICNLNIWGIEVC